MPPAMAAPLFSPSHAIDVGRDSAPAARSTPSAQSLNGAVHFVDAALREDVQRDLVSRRYLLAQVPSPLRSRMRRAIDDTVEAALALRGALPPCVEMDAPIDLVIRDQIFRARALGATGLAVMLPRVESEGALSIEDGAALSAWLAASRRAPLVVLLDEADRALRLLAPVPLAEVAGAMPLPKRSIDVGRDSALDARGDEPASGNRISPPPPVISLPRRGVMKRTGDQPFGMTPEPAAEVIAPVALAPVEAAIDAAWEDAKPAPKAESNVYKSVAALMPALPPPVEEGVTPLPAAIAAPVIADPVMLIAEPAPAIEEPAAPPQTDVPAAEARPVRRVSKMMKGGIRRLSEAPPPMAAKVASSMGVSEPVAERSREVIAEADGADPARIARMALSREHAVALDAARGPKPVTVIEKLFVDRYLPLLAAIAAGEADHGMKSVAETWRASFEHSYKEGFSAIRATGRRPSMVFDAPDIAARLARLNGARAVKLLLVDGLRHDLGDKVAPLLKGALGGKIVCVDRVVLWSAIPTTTPAQLALLGRGADGLRDAAPPSDPEPEIVRGRAVSTIRRERVGAREIMKLDVVESRLRGMGPSLSDRLDAIAAEVADSIARYAESLPPRTLLFIFGDHGFRMTAQGGGTGPASQGGASPEEVLVPGQAWLTGGVH